MRKLLTILLLVFSFTSYSQCVINQSHVISPAGPYSPGQTVTVWYTLQDFTGINVNWIHAIQINLGIGWVNLTPTQAPGNPFGSTGNWLWDLQHTYPGGLTLDQVGGLLMQEQPDGEPVLMVHSSLVFK